MRSFAVGLLVALGVAGGATAQTPAPTVTLATPIPKPSFKPLTLAPTKSIVMPKDGVDVVIANAHVPDSTDHVPIEAIQMELRPLADYIKPFYCTGTNECRLTKMPYYDQANPNLAYVDVDDFTYQIENPDHRVAGQVFPASPHDYVILPSGDHDPFYKSYLPYGPFPNDTGALPGNYSFSNLCAPTSEVMALLGALAAATTPITYIQGDNWLLNQIVQGQRPAGQMALPSPLYFDHHSHSPDPIGSPPPYMGQMSALDLQRVINMARLEGTDPSNGGYSTSFMSASYATLPNATASNARPLSAQWLVTQIRARSAIVLDMRRYRVHVSDSSQLNVNPAIRHRSVTFEKIGAHTVALDGFTDADSGTPKFFVHDPWYALAYSRTLTQFTAAGASGPPGVDFKVTLPNNAATALAIKQDRAPVPTALADLTEGQEVCFAEEAHAIHW